MKWLARLFGSQKSIDKIVETAADGIYNGLDKLVYTDEERAEALQKGREAFLKFVDIAYDQNSVRAVTRRWLAFMVVAPVMLAFVVSGAIYLVDTEYAKHLAGLVRELGPWAAGVLAFYFGPHILGSMKK